MMLPPQIPTNELQISSSSAEHLATAFKNSFEQPIWNEYAVVAAIVVSVASVFIAWASWRSTRKTAQIAENSLKNEVMRLFFDIVISLPRQVGAQLTSHDKQLICNYFDYVSSLFLRKELNERDLELLSTAMREQQFVTYASGYRRKYSTEYFKFYWEWLQR